MCWSLLIPKSHSRSTFDYIKICEPYKLWEQTLRTPTNSANKTMNKHDCPLFACVRCIETRTSESILNFWFSMLIISYSHYHIVNTFGVLFWFRCFNLAILDKIGLIRINWRMSHREKWEHEAIDIWKSVFILLGKKGKQKKTSDSWLIGCWSNVKLFTWRTLYANGKLGM